MGADAPSVEVFSLSCRDGAAPTHVSEPTADHQWSEPLLRQNAIWFCRLRWIVVTVLAAAGVAALIPGLARRVGRPAVRRPPAGRGGGSGRL